jgi:xylulose-5-phosphate/fructose-6-phosphate phosphoketolase
VDLLIKIQDFLIPTQEALAAMTILPAEFPDLKIRFINVVDLLALQQPIDRIF